MNEPSLYINGAWQNGEGDLLTSLNPARGSILWQSDAASVAQVDAAVRTAREAFPGWAARSLDDRITCLKEFQHLLQQHAEVIAEYIGEETGKPLWDCQGEVRAMIAKVDISLQAYHERTGSRDESDASGVINRLRHRPHGVLAVLGPFNFPGHLPNGHIVPALLAGNCVVFKPSHHTPRVAEQVVELWQEAGLPAGVLNLVQGDGHIGQALAGHPGLNGLLFTGSREVGIALNRQFSATPGKLLALEMGGNNPLIFDSCEALRGAVNLCIQSAFLSSGQRCTCARRLLVPRSAQGDQLLSALADALPRIRIGAYDEDPQPFMGPLISESAVDQLLAHQEQLCQQGAQPLVQARRLPRGKAFVTPGLLDVTALTSRPDSECFGPLLQVIRYTTFEEALAEANATAYGLSAGLISESEARFDQFQQQVRAGIQNWNRPLTGASSKAPFGGVGDSGNLRPSAYYAADYCAYPVASLLSPRVGPPAELAPRAGFLSLFEQAYQ